MTSLRLIQFMQIRALSCQFQLILSRQKRYGIGKLHGIKYEVLAQMNGQKSTDILKIGQVLNLIQVYDEQIELVDDSNEPLSLVDYVIYLENGSEVVGTTDANGMVQKLNINMKNMLFGMNFVERIEQ